MISQMGIYERDYAGTELRNRKLMHVTCALAKYQIFTQRNGKKNYEKQIIHICHRK